jgi:hypothetical protein
LLAQDLEAEVTLESPAAHTAADDIDPAPESSALPNFAVAARDKQKAEAYVTKHDIPIVHNSYQGVPFFFTQFSTFHHLF